LINFVKVLLGGFGVRGREKTAVLGTQS
jgi:hypothetical protein